VSGYEKGKEDEHKRLTETSGYQCKICERRFANGWQLNCEQCVRKDERQKIVGETFDMNEANKRAYANGYEKRKSEERIIDNKITGAVVDAVLPSMQEMLDSIISDQARKMREEARANGVNEGFADGLKLGIKKGKEESNLINEVAIKPITEFALNAAFAKGYNTCKLEELNKEHNDTVAYFEKQKAPACLCGEYAIISMCQSCLDIHNDGIECQVNLDARKLLESNSKTHSTFQKKINYYKKKMELLFSKLKKRKQQARIHHYIHELVKQEIGNASFAEIVKIAIVKTMLAIKDSESADGTITSPQTTSSPDDAPEKPPCICGHQYKKHGEYLREELGCEPHHKYPKPGCFQSDDELGLSDFCECKRYEPEKPLVHDYWACANGSCDSETCICKCHEISKPNICDCRDCDGEFERGKKEKQDENPLCKCGLHKDGYCGEPPCTCKHFHDVRGCNCKECKPKVIYHEESNIGEFNSKRTLRAMERAIRANENKPNLSDAIHYLEDIGKESTGAHKHDPAIQAAVDNFAKSEPHPTYDWKAISLCRKCSKMTNHKDGKCLECHTPFAYGLDR
jgi:hypothetical protein